LDSAEQFLASGSTQNAARLIVDVQLPGISGLGLQGKLAGDHNHVPIIFVSAQATHANRDVAMKHGAAGFFLSRSGGTIW
jgi:FixJ family two-component response regulator